ncbi:MAG TPA: tetratricopeptide repeat protein, partial [Allocoleopsis sp.]
EGLLEDSHPTDPIAATVQELLTDQTPVQTPVQTPTQFSPSTQKTAPVPPPEAPADRPNASSRNSSRNSSSVSSFDLIAAVEAELENPWLVLAESLEQWYEPEGYEPEVYEPEEPPPSLDPPAPPSLPTGAIDPKPSRPNPPATPTSGTPLTSVRTPSSVQTKSRQTKAIKTVELDRAVATLPIQIPQDLLAVSGQAMPLVQQIEQLHQQQAPPSVLAEAYRVLGNFYRDRIEQGEASPQNLSIALQAYEQMVLWLPESSPLWVDVLNDMGNLYWMLSRTMSSPAEALPYLQQGVRAYQLALDKLDPQTQAYTYPMVQNNLGAAYADLARYHDPIDHLELSIQAYQQALLYRSPDIDPLRYASTQNNLGTTYWNLAQYKAPVANLKHSITAYSEALHYYNPNQEPLNYAMIQNNLGTAYWNLAQHERAQDWLLLAVAAYRKALQYRTIDSVPVAYAATQNNLGTAYWHIANNLEPSQERFEYLQHAIGSYEATLQAVDRLNMHQANGSHLLNFDLFATHNNLGLAHYQTATDHSINLDITTLSNHFQSAL